MLFTFTKLISFDEYKWSYGEGEEGENVNSMFVWMSHQHGEMKDGLFICSTIFFAMLFHISLR